ncbi:MAG: hypothetical protein AVDCRST_MAG54-4179, partial [uncultured Actinomycetospora sp.]
DRVGPGPVRAARRGAAQGRAEAGGAAQHPGSAADALRDRRGGGRDRPRGGGRRHLGVGGRHRRLPQPDQPRHLRARPAPERAARGAVHHRARGARRRRRRDGRGPGRARRDAVAAVRARRGGLGVPLDAVHPARERRADARRAEPLRLRAPRVRPRCPHHRGAVRRAGGDAPARQRAGRAPRQGRRQPRRHRAGQGHPHGALRGGRVRGVPAARRVVAEHQPQARGRGALARERGEPAERTPQRRRSAAARGGGGRRPPRRTGPAPRPRPRPPARAL